MGSPTPHRGPHRPWGPGWSHWAFGGCSGSRSGPLGWHPSSLFRNLLCAGRARLLSCLGPSPVCAGWAEEVGRTDAHGGLSVGSPHPSLGLVPAYSSVREYRCRKTKKPYLSVQRRTFKTDLNFQSSRTLDCKAAFPGSLIDHSRTGWGGDWWPSPGDVWSLAVAQKRSGRRQGQAPRHPLRPGSSPGWWLSPAHGGAQQQE